MNSTIKQQISRVKSVSFDRTKKTQAILNDAVSTLAAAGLMVANMEARVKEIKAMPEVSFKQWVEPYQELISEELHQLSYKQIALGTELNTLEGILGHRPTKLPIYS